MRCLHYRAMEGPYARNKEHRLFIAHICGSHKLCGKYSKSPEGTATGANASIESNVECCKGPIKPIDFCEMAHILKNGSKLSILALIAYYTSI